VTTTYCWTRARYARDNDNAQAGDAIPNAMGRVAMLRATFHDLDPWTASTERATAFLKLYPMMVPATITSCRPFTTGFHLTACT